MNPTQENLDSGNLFDRLPDEIVLSVFDKLHDAKSLCLSMSVCKRFYSIIPQVEEVFLHIPRKKSMGKDSETPQNFFKNHFLKALMKPFGFISQMVKFKSKKEDDDYDYNSYHVPNEILKPFEEIRALNLRLPCQKNGSKSGKEFNSMLKWKAEFSSQLHSCVMLGAKSCIDKRENEEKLRENEENSRESEVIADAKPVIDPSTFPLVRPFLGVDNKIHVDIDAYLTVSRTLKLKYLTSKFKSYITN
ncbi:unnamed protein product [Fraxinus pennsylvanica]|uniref:F-box domain-containing protein n=1 Tax=Fraxinus pennsylvanica TaxID=56036 RepID=A0AAD1ZUI1_9LAMI|nr:unnamed protein product [Fraxinus pennsylvanica]